MKKEEPTVVYEIKFNTPNVLRSIEEDGLEVFIKRSQKRLKMSIKDIFEDSKKIKQES